MSSHLQSRNNAAAIPLPTLHSNRLALQENLTTLDAKKAELKKQLNAVEEETRRVEKELDDLETKIYEVEAALPTQMTQMTQAVKEESVSSNSNSNSNSKGSTGNLSFTQYNTQNDEYLTEPTQLSVENSPGNLPAKKRRTKPVFLPVHEERPQLALVTSSSEEEPAKPKEKLKKKKASEKNRDSYSELELVGSTVNAPPRPPSASPFFQPQRPSTTTTTTTTNASIVPGISSLLLKTLRETFKLSSFRFDQLSTLTDTINNKDCVTLMPTGGGKSLCYQISSYLNGRVLGNKSSVTFCISPLLSLITDQVKQMNAIVPNSAVAFCTGVSLPEQTKQWNRIRDPKGGVCLAFFTPEKLEKSQKMIKEFKKLAAENRLARFVIDECHCCCTWGHDFREDYTKLGKLKREFPSVPVLALTATAPPPVLKDVIKILMLQNPSIKKAPLKRDNLRYSVLTKAGDAADQTSEYIRHNHPRSSGIIYTLSKKEADDLADKLGISGISAESYHSDVSASEKEKILSDWMSGRTQVVVATIAFGLGINKPNVRFVIHHSLSKSIFGYYQESGRAGRDGKPADCVLLYSPKDVGRMRCLVDGQQSGEKQLYTMVRYCEERGSSTTCQNLILRGLGDLTKEQMQQNGDFDNDNESEMESVNIAKHAVALIKYLQTTQGLTVAQIATDWRAKDPHPTLANHEDRKDLSKSQVEHMVVQLIVKGILGCIVYGNKYKNNMYVVWSGEHAQSALDSENPTIECKFEKTEKRASGKKPRAKKTATAAVEPQWQKKVDPKQRQKLKESAAGKGGKGKKRVFPNKENASNKITSYVGGGKKRVKQDEIIDLLSDDDDDEALEQDGRAMLQEKSRNVGVGGTRIDKDGWQIPPASFLGGESEPLIVPETQYGGVDDDEGEYQFDDDYE